MKLEIATLENIDAWSVVDCYDSDGAPHHVIPSTWAFKCNWYPDGRIKKFKAHFCARGDKQLEETDFFETYAPVVHWTTIWLMFILEILLGLKSKQGNVLCAFLHGELEPGENVYVKMPLGFSQHSKDGTRKVIKLKKTLYGLHQSPQAFWKYITEMLEACGLEQSKFEPCLFVGTKVICVVYVDDIIFWSKDTEDINSSRELSVDLEQEDGATGFLGVTLEWDPETGLLETKQTGLIKQVIKALGLDNGLVKGKYTPSESKLLVKNINGEAASGAFSYNIVVGMLLYLSWHTRPDITFAVNCCARYMFCLKHLHELALKCIDHYLKQTSDHGMVMNPQAMFAKLIHILMLTLQGCMVMRIRQIPLAIRAALDSSSLLQSVPCFGNWNCKQRQLYPRWKPTSLLFLHAAESCFPSLTWFVHWLRPPIFLLEIQPWMSPSTKTIQAHWWWLRLCLHILLLEASIMQSRWFGFVRRFSREISNWTKLTQSNIWEIFSPKISQELFLNISKRRSWDGNSLHSLIRIWALNIRFQSREGVLYQLINLVLYCQF